MQFPTAQAAEQAEGWLHKRFEQVGKEWFRLVETDEDEWKPVVEDALERFTPRAQRVGVVRRVVGWFTLRRMWMVAGALFITATVGRFIALWARIPAVILAVILAGWTVSALVNSWWPAVHPQGKASIGQGLMVRAGVEAAKTEQKTNWRMVGWILTGVVLLFVVALSPEWWWWVPLWGCFGVLYGLFAGYCVHRGNRPHVILDHRFITG